MSTNLSEAEAGETFTKIFRLLEKIQLSSMSATAWQMLIIAGIQTMDVQRPRAITATDLSNSLGLTVSAVARLLAKMSDPKDLNLLESTKNVPGSRAEGFVLTNKGRKLVEDMLAIFVAENYQLPPTHGSDVFSEKFALAKNLPPKLTKSSWDEENLTLVVSPIEYFLSTEIKGWIEEFIKNDIKVLRHTKDGVRLKFNNIESAVYFVLRWC